jgi:hypothetical protein
VEYRVASCGCPSRGNVIYDMFNLVEERNFLIFGPDRPDERNAGKIERSVERSTERRGGLPNASSLCVENAMWQRGLPSSLLKLLGGLVRLERLVRHWMTTIMKFFETLLDVITVGLLILSFSSVDE